jgi:Spy/CpxP family protein refolding chaperone
LCTNQAVVRGKELSNPSVFAVDKTLPGLTESLLLSRPIRVPMSVRKSAGFLKEAFAGPGFEGRKSMKSIRFLVAALAVLLGSAIAKSQTADAPPPPPMHGFGLDGHMMGFFAKYLDVSDDQKSQMKAVLQKERPTLQPLLQQVHQMEQQLKPYEEGTYDAAKVQAAVAQQSQTLVQLKVEETRIHNELFQLLTPDQQSKLKEFEANRAARMQQRMQNAPPASSEE